MGAEKISGGLRILEWKTLYFSMRQDQKKGDRKKSIQIVLVFTEYCSEWIEQNL